MYNNPIYNFNDLNVKKDSDSELLYEMWKTRYKHQNKIQKTSNVGTWGTDLTKLPSVLINELRNNIVMARGVARDISNKFQEHKSSIDELESNFNSIIGGLYNVLNVAIANETFNDDMVLGESLSFNSRRIELNNCPCCFVCGTLRRNYNSNNYLNNIAAFVKSKEDGEKIVKWFSKGAKLDYKEQEPNWIQVKIGSCDEHLQNLEYLHKVTSDYNVIRKIDIINAIKFQG